jgi:hypothetical protein
MGRTIYILGEDHLRADQTDLKLSILAVSKEYKITDMMVFDEGSTSNLRRTPRKVVFSVPIPSPIERLERLFWILHSCAELKQESDAKTIDLVVDLMNDVFSIPIPSDAVMDLLPDIFKKCKRQIHIECSKTPKNTTVIQTYIESVTFDTLEINPEFGKAFYKTYFLVDTSIVDNIKREHRDAPPDTTFIVIVGEQHVDALEHKLLSADPSFIVYTIHEEEKDMELDTRKYKLAIDGGKPRKKTRVKRR